MIAQHIVHGEDIHGNKLEMKDTFASRSWNCDKFRRILCCKKDLAKVIIPEGIGEIRAWDNQLTELILPNSTVIVECTRNKLTELHIPKGAKEVNVCGNQITELTVPSSVDFLFCTNNPIKKLIFEEGVEHIYCQSDNTGWPIYRWENNEITVWCDIDENTEMIFPKSLKKIRIPKEVTGLEKYVGKIEMELI